MSTKRYGDPATSDPTSPDASPDPSPPASPDPSPPPPAPPAPAPSPDLPPPTAPAPTMQTAFDDLTAQVAATTTIEDSCVTLLKSTAAMYVAAAPGNAAVAALSAKLRASAEKLGQAITDCTPFAAPAVTPQQAMAGGTKSKR